MRNDKPNCKQNISCFTEDYVKMFQEMSAASHNHNLICIGASFE